MSTYSKVIITALWAVSVICCFIMKKIQPESFKLYVGYVIFVCFVITATSYILVSQG